MNQNVKNQNLCSISSERVKEDIPPFAVQSLVRKQVTQ